MSDSTHILDTVIGHVDAGRAVALCVIVGTRGSVPQHAGAMLCVDQDARITGTLGGGCVEAEIRRTAHQRLSAGDEGAAVARVCGFDLDADFAHENGLICGGHMDVAISVIASPDDAGPIREAVQRMRAGESAMLPARVQTPDGLMEYRIHVEAPPKLIIAGGGHIGKVLAELMVPLGFYVRVIDDRCDFAGTDRFPPPINPIVGDIPETLRSQPIDANTYIVIVTRGHKHDEQALGAVVNSRAKYVGMIGSQRKIEIIFDNLRREGVSQRGLDHVHTPIGLDIKAVTVEEIAVSIAAELISVRRAEYRKAVEGPIPVSH